MKSSPTRDVLRVLYYHLLLLRGIHERTAGILPVRSPNFLIISSYLREHIITCLFVWLDISLDEKWQLEPPLNAIASVSKKLSKPDLESYHTAAVRLATTTHVSFLNLAMWLLEYQFPHYAS